MHQVEMKTKPGQMRPTTVRDAKQLGLFPSVTSIIKILSRPQLESWKQEQAVLAALTLPRKDGEPETEFAKGLLRMPSPSPSKPPAREPRFIMRLSNT